MAAFRRVEPQQAGPKALGILVPPGLRTLVILRPRSLDCDLLPARWDGDAARPPRFCTFERDQAAQVARQLQQSLAEAAARRVNPVETLGDARAREFQIWVRAAALFWIVCRRAIGRTYEPQLFTSREQALRVAETLATVVWPDDDAEQEYYFNTQKFV